MAELENTVFDSTELPVDIFIQDTKENQVQVSEHWHNCFEFLYVLEGSALHIINGTAFQVGEKQIVTLRNGDIHGIYCNDPARTRIFVLKFLPSVAFSFPGSYGHTKYLPAFLCKCRPVTKLNADQASVLESVFKRMEEESSGRAEGCEYILKGLILQFIGYLMREQIFSFSWENGTDQEKKDLEEITAYVEKKYFEEISLTEVADKLHMNYYYTSRYFKRLTGKNFKQFLDFIRVSEAGKLLIETDKTVTEIAGLCGFSCPQAMNRTYSRVTGKSPTAIRAGSRALGEIGYGLK